MNDLVHSQYQLIGSLSTSNQVVGATGVTLYYDLFTTSVYVESGDFL
jgi:hypothetical protein